jgi:hypothetical protein
MLYILFTILYGLMTPFTLLPDASLPSAFTSAMTSASAYISALNDFLPVSTLLTIIGLLVVIEIAINTFMLINWAIKKIPTIG